MALPQTKANIESLCASISAEVARSFPGTELYFILHHAGQREEQAESILSKLSSHPAHAEARGLLKFRKLNGDQSVFLGLALGYEKKLLGFKSAPKSLGFISLNLSEHESETERFLTLYRLIGQFLDLTQTLHRLKKPPEPGVVMQPKRSSLSVARDNLKADIFGVIHMARCGEFSALSSLAKKRGMESITAKTNWQPEEYPFPIALDVTTYVSKHLPKLRPGLLVTDSFQTTQSILQSFEKENLETWFQFAKPAQTMAWSGYTPQQILGTAIHTSPNPFVKATGHLIAEITNIFPSPQESLPAGYNPYVAREINQINHQRLMEETFEMVLVHAMESDSHLPLVRVANNQNENLVKGRFSGWCAHALQAAAKAYIGAAHRGVPANLAAKIEFQTVQQQTQWQDLERVSDFVLEQHSSGEGITLSGVAQWCSQFPELRMFSESINLTLNDPTYEMRLKLANDTPSLGHTPAVPQGPAAPGPALQPGYQPRPGTGRAPHLSLGGGGMMASPPPAVRKSALLQEPEGKLSLAEDKD